MTTYLSNQEHKALMLAQAKMLSAWTKNCDAKVFVTVSDLSDVIDTLVKYIEDNE